MNLTIEQCIAENIPFSPGYRDFEGYKGAPPNPSWPGGAKIAVSFVLNYEEGGEYSVINGDVHSETLLQEVTNAPTRLAGRDVQMETQFEYGTRAGVWRLARIFEEAGVKCTVYAVGQSILKSPDAAKALYKAGHEFASHGYRWIDHHSLPLAVEKAQIEKGVEAVKTITGKPPVGWYLGRPSVSSRALIAQVYEEQGLELVYNSDSYADELPYWVKHPVVEGKGLLIVPYTYDVNDMKYGTSPGFGNPKDWLDYATLAFDELYAEGEAGAPKMMTIGLHNRIVGRPARAWALRELIRHMQAKGAGNVWFATREEIARHWTKTHPFEEFKFNKIGHFL